MVNRIYHEQFKTCSSKCFKVHCIGLHGSPAVKFRLVEFDTPVITIFCWYDLLWLLSISRCFKVSERSL